jgi:YVTN family beta-propeller protein
MTWSLSRYPRGRSRDRKPTAVALDGSNPQGVAVPPDSSKVYVTNGNFSAPPPGTVSVIDVATNKVIATIPVGAAPFGVAVTPDGSKVYVANGDFSALAGTVSVIDTASNTVSGLPIPVGSDPIALGLFIAPPPLFAGTPGFRTVTARVSLRWPLRAAATALGYSSVQALQNAIQTFCAG